MSQPAPANDATVSDEALVDRLRAIVQDAHLHLLVGAGTSTGLCEPLGDIENALTELERAPSSPKAHAIARASIQALYFDEVLWPNVTLVDGPGSRAQAVLGSYERLLRVLNQLLVHRRSTLLSKRISIFTTNVDLAFEVCADRLRLALNDGFTGRFSLTYDSAAFGTLRQRLSPRYGNRFEIPSFDLMKIHGSVGWTWASDRIAFEPDLASLRRLRRLRDELSDRIVKLDDPRQLDVAKLLETAESLAQENGDATDPAVAAFAAAYDELIIVNPEKTKFATTVMTETYYELIRIMANELERETSVLFVHGFSFRDEHLRTILLRAARSNPTLQIVVFCYMPADRASYEQLMPETAIPNGNLRYIAPPSDARPYDLDTVVSKFLVPLLSPATRGGLEPEAGTP